MLLLAKRGNVRDPLRIFFQSSLGNSAPSSWNGISQVSPASLKYPMFLFGHYKSHAKYEPIFSLLTPHPFFFFLLSLHYFLF